MPGPYAPPLSPGAALPGMTPGTTPPPVPPGVDPGQWWNADPTAGFWEYLRTLGLNTTDPVSRYAQSQYQPTYNQFLADAARDPTVGFYDYLNQRRPNYADQYANLAPEQRGDYSGRTHAARARWVTPR